MKSLFFIILIGFSTTVSAQEFYQSQKTVSADRMEDDIFGQAVSINGEYGLIGASLNDFDENQENALADAGSAYFFKFENDNWEEVQKIVPSDRAENSHFGHAIALSSSIAAIGARNKDDNKGGAYIFELENEIWQETAILQPTDDTSRGRFGTSIAIYNETVAVGASDQNERRGAVYIYEKNGDWTETQKLIASDAMPVDGFGTKIAFFDDMIAISAPSHEFDSNGQNPIQAAGAIYIFEKDNSGQWNETQKIVTSDRALGDLLGSDIALNEDYLIVGASDEDDDENGQNEIPSAGSVYIFEKNANSLWEEKQKVVPSERAQVDLFGGSISLENSTLIVGARQNDSNENGEATIPNSGSVYIFKNNGDSWEETQKITANDRGENDLFGYSTGISEGTILITSREDDKDENGEGNITNAGSAYFFIDDVLSIADFRIHSDIKLYPNPTSNFLTINLPENIILKKILIVDMLGKQMLSSAKSSIDISDLSSGNYIVQLTTNKGKVSKRFIKY
ncbi:T9SS C-terminal target domain-containing protein [Dokdonia sinensis]|uniref:T9SS C-terminal target domain-containing protein n=1 Tax=Dokdonia sinensis TaxID=2479847 RepID=A0A3M0FZA6_9FLAO|nr:T9SS type A sorting domain-containing protein [Dokdonia sinensis]RMB58004.1 T9SS C-terminal target domain-containing protein [Dokdonia sinensis]